jgi:hypothetical protein
MYEFDEKLICKVLRPGKPHCYEVLIVKDDRIAELVCVFQLYENEEVVGHYGAYGEEGKKPLLTIAKDSLVTGRPRQWTSIEDWSDLNDQNKKRDSPMN